MTDHPTMPPKVAAALVAVMGTVPKLNKGEKNTHGNYNFASIDDFLEAVRPLCAAQGLIILQDEESFEMMETTGRDGNGIKWLVMKFRFTLVHSSGEMFDGGIRTAMVNAAMGSQAFGAAQSYALKQYMRSLFQIATGENVVDADAHPPADLPEVAPKATKWKGAPGAKTAWTVGLREFVSDLEACADLDQLNALVKSPEGMKIQKECREWMVDWYDGAEDIEGLGARIARLQTQLTNHSDAYEPEALAP